MKSQTFLFLSFLLFSNLAFAQGKFSSVECYECTQVMGDDCNACNKTGDWQIRSGLKVTTRLNQNFIDAPFTTTVSGNEVTFRELAAEKESIVVNLTDTKFSRMFDFIEYIKNCSCGGSGGGTGGENTDNQLLTFNSTTNTLSISGGNSVTLEDGQSGVENLIYDGSTLTVVTSENDYAVTVTGNVIQTGQVINIQGVNYNSQTPISTILQALANMTFPDNDNQNLNLSGNNLSITNGNSVNLSSYMDNTDDQMLNVSKSGSIYSVSIEDGNTIQLDVTDNDNNPTNEFQNLNLSGNTLTITNGNSVNLPESVNTDNQTLSYNSETAELSIAGGNSIVLPSGGGTVNVTEVGTYYHYQILEDNTGNIEAFVEASDTTVTISRFQNVVTVTIPVGVDLDYLAVYGNASDWSNFEEFNIKLDYIGDEFNTSQFNAKPPVLAFINQYNNGLPFPGTTVGSFWKYSNDSPPTPQMQITRNQSGQQTVTFANAGGNGSPRFIAVLGL